MGSIGANRGQGTAEARRIAEEGLAMTSRVQVERAIQLQSEAFSTALTEKFDGQALPADIRNIDRQVSSGNRTFNIRGTNYTVQDVMDYDRAQGGAYTIGHLYVPVNGTDKGSFFVSSGGTLWHDATQYLNARRR